MKKKKLNSKWDTRLEASEAEAEIEAQIADILQKLDGKVYEWLLLTVQHDGPCEGAPHDEREDLVRDLAKALTCHCNPEAIFHQGKRLTAEEVAALETEALDLLGPISRAKAEGKF